MSCGCTTAVDLPPLVSPSSSIFAPRPFTVPPMSVPLRSPGTPAREAQQQALAAYIASHPGHTIIPPRLSTPRPESPPMPSTPIAMDDEPGTRAMATDGDRTALVRDLARTERWLQEAHDQEQVDQTDLQIPALIVDDGHSSDVTTSSATAHTALENANARLNQLKRGTWPSGKHSSRVLFRPPPNPLSSFTLTEWVVSIDSRDWPRWCEPMLKLLHSPPLPWLCWTLIVDCKPWKPST